jgi:uncharacterized phage protein gp47/JayE
MSAQEPTLQELTTPITRQEFESSILKVMAAVGNQTTGWQTGSVMRALIVAVSVVLAGLSKIITLVVSSGFLELATGHWLTLLAKSVYGVIRKTATYAAGNVVVNNYGAGVFNESIGDLRVIGENGQEYVSTEPFSCLAGQLGVVVHVVATDIGTKGGYAPAGTITRFSGTYNGLTVTNPTALKASDNETDDDLRSRCKVAAASKSPNGPRDAYEFAAKSAMRADGTGIDVNRVRVVRGPGDGSCMVYVATPSGAVDGTAGDITTDLGCVQDKINRWAVPEGMSANVVSANAVTVSVTYEVWIYDKRSGLTEAEAKKRIEDAVSKYISTRAIGADRLSSDDSNGFVFINRLKSTALNSIPNDSAYHCVLSTPTSNVVCSADTVPVAGIITGIVHFVSDSLSIAA